VTVSAVIVVSDPAGPQAAEAKRRVQAYFSLKNYGSDIRIVSDARQAVMTALGEYILVTEGLLRTPIKEVDKLIAAHEKGADIAVGTRKGWFGMSLRCAFKSYKKEAAKAVFSDPPSSGLRTALVSVMWSERGAS
jgi:hypothetical protein